MPRRKKQEVKVNNVDSLEGLMQETYNEGGLLKVKDSAIRIKLELAKLQSDIIKNRGDAEAAIQERSNGKASTEDFKSIRELLKRDKDIENNFGSDFE